MKLHFAMRTKAVRVRWMLEELELPYELIKVADPREAPLFLDEGVVLSECLAICLYLAERFPKLLGSSERAEWLQWLAFTEVTLEPAIATPEPVRLGEVLTLVETRLVGREFICGSSFSAADVLMASVLHRANAGKLLEGHPKLVEYVINQTKRPASRRAVGM